MRTHLTAGWDFCDFLLLFSLCEPFSSKFVPQKLGALLEARGFYNKYEERHFLGKYMYCNLRLGH